jgi:hypothetical protein
VEIRQAVRTGLYDQAHMPTDQERFGVLKEQLEQAAEVLGQLPESAWPTPADRQRFERIFAYAQIVFQTTDSDLVSPAMLQQFSEALQQWIDAPDAIAGTSDPWRDRLLDGIARLPASRGRDIEQDIRRTDPSDPIGWPTNRGHPQMDDGIERSLTNQAIVRVAANSRHRSGDAALGHGACFAQDPGVWDGAQPLLPRTSRGSRQRRCAGFCIRIVGVAQSCCRRWLSARRR